MAQRDGRNAAALMTAQDSAAPSAWGVHLASADAAKTAAKVVEAGGRIVFGPDTMADIGTLAGATDPGGSYFGVWQSGTHTGFDVTNEPGSFCWTENHTRDAKAVDAFYDAVFGYDTQQIGDGEHFDYKAWSLPGAPDPVAGRYRLGPDDRTDGPAAFLVYFVVEDCDEAAATVQRLGGRVLRAPEDTPFGRTANVADDQGAVFAVIDVQRKVAPTPGE
jgi:predicted enzyme related to lactoylglutathione lyase